MSNGTRYPAFLHATADRSLLASVAIQRNDRFLGVLVGCDSFPGSLSLSEEYVLQAIASELADRLEEEHLMGHTSAVCLKDSGSLNAGLRLSESGGMDGDQGCTEKPPEHERERGVSPHLSDHCRSLACRSI